MRIVIIHWPADPERGQEVYGPFDSEAQRQQWVNECMEAAADGWELLHGAHYMLTAVAQPFDATALWEVKA